MENTETRDYQLRQLQRLANKVYFRKHQELFEYIIKNNTDKVIYEQLGIESYDELYLLLVQNIKLQ